MVWSLTLQQLDLLCLSLSSSACRRFSESGWRSAFLSEACGLRPRLRPALITVNLRQKARYMFLRGEPSSMPKYPLPLSYGWLAGRCSSLGLELLHGWPAITDPAMKHGASLGTSLAAIDTRFAAGNGEISLAEDQRTCQDSYSMACLRPG